MEIMTLIIVVASVISVVPGYLYFKLPVVQKNTTRASDIIDRLATNNKDYLLAYELNRKHKPIMSFNRLVLHPLKWTFDSMFPGLSEYEKKIAEPNKCTLPVNETPE